VLLALGLHFTTNEFLGLYDTKTRTMKLFDSTNIPLLGKGNEAEDMSDFKLIHNPTHPDADENGYVKMPNVNIVTEMVDMMSASRAYEANITVINAQKEMAQESPEN